MISSEPLRNNNQKNRLPSNQEIERVLVIKAYIQLA